MKFNQELIATLKKGYEIKLHYIKTFPVQDEEGNVYDASHLRMMIYHQNETNPEKMANCCFEYNIDSSYSNDELDDIFTPMLIAARNELEKHLTNEVV